MRLRNKQVNACGETFCAFFVVVVFARTILAATKINTILSFFLAVVHDCQMAGPLFSYSTLSVSGVHAIICISL